MIYQVTRRGDGLVAQIEADRYVQDGSGTWFYAADGGTVASFRDGIIGR